MSVAQKLYEGIDLGGNMEGLITYMRCDSTRLSDLFVKDAMQQIELARTMWVSYMRKTQKIRRMLMKLFVLPMC